MNYADNKERERIVAQALSARTLPEIERAVQELSQWIREHPDDWSAEDALEPLALRHSVLHLQEPENIPVAKAS